MKYLLKFVLLLLPALLASEQDSVGITQSTRTLLTPHLEQAITPGKNVLYCSTFQIAWNTLQDEIIKDSIRLTGDPPIARALNKRLSTKEDLSEESYVAMADWLTEEYLKRINQTLRKTFGNEAPKEVKEPIEPNAILAYAYLFKNLKFAKEFDRLKKPIRFAIGPETTDVKAFGIEKGSWDKHRHELWQQVNEIDIRNEDDFIIRLASKSEKDEITLAKVKPLSTLLETFAAVEKRINNAGPHYHTASELIIPVFDFNVERHFPELEGRWLLNKGWESHFIGKAIQWIRFKLDEKGVALKSEARIEYLTGIEYSLVFDKPFLIYLKQKGGKYPYFAMWVDNPDLMSKAK